MLKYPTAFLSVLAIAALSGAGGCCSHGPQREIEHTMIYAPGHPHAIFNPDFSPAPLAIVDRADWPATYVPDAEGEITLYDAQFVDIHERGLTSDGGYLFRRFESNRRGHLRR